MKEKEKKKNRMGSDSKINSLRIGETPQGRGDLEIVARSEQERAPEENCLTKNQKDWVTEHRKVCKADLSRRKPSRSSAE